MISFSRVYCNNLFQFAIWWPTGGDEVFPWNPKPEQRANVLVYSLSKLDEYVHGPLKTFDLFNNLHRYIF